MPEEPMMTQAQRDELKKLCLKADVPDKSGELLTQEGAQKYIDDLITQLSSEPELRITTGRPVSLGAAAYCDAAREVAWMRELTASEDDERLALKMRLPICPRSSHAFSSG